MLMGAFIPTLMHRIHQNSAVKRVWARVVLGWVTSWEVLVLHPFLLNTYKKKSCCTRLFGKKSNGRIWKVVPPCLMWCLFRKRNACYLEGPKCQSSWTPLRLCFAFEDLIWMDFYISYLFYSMLLKTFFIPPFFVLCSYISCNWVAALCFVFYFIFCNDFFT